MFMLNTKRLSGPQEPPAFRSPWLVAMHGTLANKLTIRGRGFMRNIKRGATSVNCALEGTVDAVMVVGFSPSRRDLAPRSDNVASESARDRRSPVALSRSQN